MIFEDYWTAYTFNAKCLYLYIMIVEEGQLDKAVRDNIVIEADGAYVSAGLLDLAKKLVEESIEFLVSLDAGELADVFEVLVVLIRKMGIKEDEFAKLVKEKRKRKGGFEWLWKAVIDEP